MLLYARFGMTHWTKTAVLHGGFGRPMVTCTLATGSRTRLAVRGCLNKVASSLCQQKNVGAPSYFVGKVVGSVFKFQLE